MQIGDESEFPVLEFGIIFLFDLFRILWTTTWRRDHFCKRIRFLRPGSFVSSDIWEQSEQSSDLKEAEPDRTRPFKSFGILAILFIYINFSR